LTSTSDIDPNGVVPIPDYGPESLQIIIARLQCSTRFQHYILRADELDAVGRHIETALQALPHDRGSSEETARLEALRSSVLEAQELVLAGSPAEAVEKPRGAIG
jgi:hypothetical protein